MVERRLGRGLETLISRTTANESQQVVEVPLDEIRPNPDQPRQVIEPDALEGLAQSIRRHGVLQPVIVQRNAEGYQLVAGERRLRASRLAGRTTIPALVIEASGRRSLELALIENIQRENLNALEEATAYEALLAREGSTQVELAEQLGKSRVAVTNALRLLELPDEIKGFVKSGVLSAGQARALLGARSPEAMLDLARLTVRDRLSVREVERRVIERRSGNERRGGRSGNGSQKKRSPYEDELRTLFGTKVLIEANGDRGRVSFEFYSDRDRQRLIHLLLTAGRTVAGKAGEIQVGA
ncbi:MAG TPA: ParB/RepB/Spo0J family partition protein [Planctomycetota bacterium]|nr:ParB/RepB/Spo0J family partition protein [Planctomycetota bacterium]